MVVGTLYVIDTWPRRASRSQMEQLRNHAAVALQQLVANRQERGRRRAEFEFQMHTRHFENSVDLNCITDRAGKLPDIHGRWVEILGWDFDALRGRSSAESIHGDDCERTAAAIARLNDGHSFEGLRIRHRHVNGSHVWLEWTALAPLLRETELCAPLLANACEVTLLTVKLTQADAACSLAEFEALNPQFGVLAQAMSGTLSNIAPRDTFERLALTDELTEFPNRCGFVREVSREFARSRCNGPPFALSLLDLDPSTSVDDPLGHNVGDELLRRVALLMHVHLRDADLRARVVVGAKSRPFSSKYCLKRQSGACGHC